MGLKNTIDKELQAFCEGYAKATSNERGFYDLSIVTLDDWIVWRDYDINFFGADYDDSLTLTQLGVCAYPAGWRDSLPKPLYDFVVGV
jgi:hypothetical protein